MNNKKIMKYFFNLKIFSRYLRPYHHRRHMWQEVLRCSLHNTIHGHSPTVCIAPGLVHIVHDAYIQDTDFQLDQVKNCLTSIYLLIKIVYFNYKRKISDLVYWHHKIRMYNIRLSINASDRFTLKFYVSNL